MLRSWTEIQLPRGTEPRKNKDSILEPCMVKGVAGEVRCTELAKHFHHMVFCLLRLKWIFPCLPCISKPEFLCKNDLSLPLHCCGGHYHPSCVVQCSRSWLMACLNIQQSLGNIGFEVRYTSQFLNFLSHGVYIYKRKWYLPELLRGLNKVAQLSLVA